MNVFKVKGLYPGLISLPLVPTLDLVLNFNESLYAFGWKESQFMSFSHPFGFRFIGPHNGGD